MRLLLALALVSAACLPPVAAPAALPYELVIDPLESPQWTLAMVNASAAWGLLPGHRDVVVAIVDTGADLAHADLQANFWDGNLLHGASVARPYGFFALLPVGPETTTMDELGHGTLVSGVITATPGNHLGIRGIADVDLMIVKYAGLGSLAFVAQLAEGIRVAVDLGADVVSVSQVVRFDDAALRDAVAYAEANGVVVVAASGNDGSNDLLYPAAYATVLSVGAVDDARAVWSMSTWGKVDIAAPGVEVVTTALENQYAIVSGTSLATPHVAGAAALVRAADPALTPAEVRALLLATATAHADPRAGHGILDVGRAVREALA